MKQIVSRRRYLTTVAVVMAFMVVAVPIMAQNDVAAGRAAGTRAAQANINKIEWFAIGCLGGLGVIAAYVIEPEPPATALLGKSPEYVAAYTDAYKTTGKAIQTRMAWTGLITPVAAYFILLVLIEFSES